MFKSIKEFIFGKPAPTPAPVEVAPYKVELPLVQLEQVAAPTPEELKVVAEMADAIHDTGKPETAAPAKKPRKPRAPKVVAEKPVAKKAAPVKKAAAIKAAPKAKTAKSKKV